MLVRDRGDGIRGSGSGPDAKRAITHIEPVRTVAGKCTVIRCRLETGRTHQIRIHLSEFGHMLCGEKVYVKPQIDSSPVSDSSRAPRQALHSAELEFVHPVTKQSLHFHSELPNDLERWLGM
jgi:23S rRNA pseudouridine1911/1915/1917 synthase